MTWVKFHSELRQGAKRGLSRAARFVYMELSLESRPKKGVIELPVGMDDVAGLVDILGGNAREVREAIPALTGGPEPMISFEGEKGARRCVVAKWSKWNATEVSGASTERSRRHRQALQPPDSDDATVMQRSLHAVANGDATDEQRERNWLQRSPSIRSDQRREDQISGSVVPQLPTGGPEPVGGASRPIRDLISEGLKSHPALAHAWKRAVVEALEGDLMVRGLRPDEVSQAFEWAAKRATAESVEAGGGPLVVSRVTELVLTGFGNAKTVGRRKIDQRAATAQAIEAERPPEGYIPLGVRHDIAPPPPLTGAPK